MSQWLQHQVDSCKPSSASVLRRTVGRRRVDWLLNATMYCSVRCLILCQSLVIGERSIRQRFANFCVGIMMGIWLHLVESRCKISLWPVLQPLMELLLLGRYGNSTQREPLTFPGHDLPTKDWHAVGRLRVVLYNSFQTALLLLLRPIWRGAGDGYNFAWKRLLPKRSSREVKPCYHCVINMVLCWLWMTILSWRLLLGQMAYIWGRAIWLRTMPVNCWVNGPLSAVQPILLSRFRRSLKARQITLD